MGKVLEPSVPGSPTVVAMHPLVAVLAAVAEAGQSSRTQEQALRRPGTNLAACCPSVVEEHRR